jgi:sterol desaturase/sphingolipid hydroxylase (fatty acid hydroxylase superfamily)
MNLLPDISELIVALVLSAVLIGIGRVIEHFWPAQPDQRSEDLRFDLKYGFVNLGFSWLLAPIAGAVSVYLVNRAGGGFIRLSADGWWFLASLFAYLITKDLMEYFWHRAQHRIPVLWTMHSLHHSEEAFNVSTGWRHFWLESALRTAAIFPILGILFETPLAILNTATLLYMLNHAWAHLNIRHSMGRWGLVIMNPQFHRLHHSVDPKHWNRNFADLFPMIDVIFGTAYVPERNEFPATGLVPRDAPVRVVDAIVWPFRRSGELMVADPPKAGSPSSDVKRPVSSSDQTALQR